MGRRNIGSPGLWALLDSGGYIHAVIVHGNGNQTATRALEDTTRKTVAGFLHPNRASIPKENARRDLKGLLGTGNHHYLAGIAANRPRGSQIMANGLTTTFRTPWISVVYGAHEWAFGVTGDEVRPNWKGKAVKSRLVHTKRSPPPNPRRPFKFG